jgi:hypothetical protein
MGRYQRLSRGGVVRITGGPSYDLEGCLTLGSAS